MQTVGLALRANLLAPGSARSGLNTRSWRLSTEEQVESNEWDDRTPIDWIRDDLRSPDLSIAGQARRLLAYAAGGSFAANSGTSETLAAARQILRDKDQIRWSSLIAAVVRTKPIASE
jgi:hypothetical protein